MCFDFFKCVHSPNADVQLNMQKKSCLYSLSEGQCLYFIFLEFSWSLTGGWNATERANDFPLYIALHDGQRLPIIFISWKFSRTFMLSKNTSRKLSGSFMSLKEYFLENFQNLQARLSSNVGAVNVGLYEGGQRLCLIKILKKKDFVLIFLNVFTHPMLMCNWTCKKKFLYLKPFWRPIFVFHIFRILVFTHWRLKRNWTREWFSPLYSPSWWPTSAYYFYFLEIFQNFQRIFLGSVMSLKEFFSENFHNLQAFK